MTDPLKRYPRSLAGGFSVRPLKAEDESALVEFFRKLPVDERQLFKDDVTRAETIRGWVRNLDYANILPLLVLEGKAVVADATLHRDKRGWSRHVGKLRISIDPDRRGRGLAKQLVQEFLSLAPTLGVAILHAEVLDVQKGAQVLFDSLGFHEVAVLPQHAIDLAGRVHDVRIWSCTVTPPERLAPEASLAEADADVGGNQ
jgi:L-amino acid N-acyltransferase YncA